MTTHTPGPWTVKSRAYDFRIETGPHNEVASAHTKWDARLIAAAPEMLAALQKIADTLERLRHTQGWSEQDRSGIAASTWCGPFVHAAEDTARALLARIGG